MTEFLRPPEGRRPLPLQWIEEDGFDLTIQPHSDLSDRRSPPPPLVSTETSFLPPPRP